MSKITLILALLLSDHVVAEGASGLPVLLNDGCRDVENISWVSEFNNYSPLALVLKTLGYQQDARIKTLKVEVVDPPRHGILVLNETRSAELIGRYSWMYHANPAYQGPDQAKYRVDIDGRQFDITVQYFVHALVLDDEDPYLCEIPGSRSWILD